MNIRKIKTITKLFFIICAIITAICVTLTFVWNPDNFVDYIISIISVAVTVILGVATYLQSEIQLEIDNISSKPFCKIINFESVENYEEKGYQPYGVTSFPVKELLGIEMVITPSMKNKNILTYYVPIDLEAGLMRIAYVAMTRPRRLLMIAMPENKKLKEYKRFSVDKWDYEYI